MKKTGKQAKAGRGRLLCTLLLITVGICAVAAGLSGCDREKKHSPAAGQQEDAVGQSGASSAEAASGQNGEPVQEEVSSQTEASGQNGEPVQEETSGQTEASGTDEMPPQAETISIVGDSISTFKGAIPEGYYDFFPENGTVGSIQETWWRQAFEELGLELYVNASSSGATCAGDSTSVENPQVGCDELRTGNLTDAAGNAPDIILVYMGTNDLLESIPMGDNDGTAQVGEGVIANFSDAYTLMLDKLRAKYPQAQIYCCTILPVGTWGKDGGMIPFLNGADGGLQASDYAEKIRQIAENKGLQVIDLYSCGVTMENILEMTSDGVHPTPAGMRCIANAVKESLK